jgi:hypothetical protein
VVSKDNVERGQTPNDEVIFLVVLVAKTQTLVLVGTSLRHAPSHHAFPRHGVELTIKACVTKESV